MLFKKVSNHYKLDSFSYVSLLLLLTNHVYLVIICLLNSAFQNFKIHTLSHSFHPT